MTGLLIGITIGHTQHPDGMPMLSVQESYTRSVINAGGIPVLIPLGLKYSDLQQIFEHVDGILLTGGGDIDPGRFGGEFHPSVHQVDPERDETEIRLAAECIQRKKPILGICRGLQVLNVALGGDLHTDIRSQIPHALAHEWVPGLPWSRLVHSVSIEAGSQLAAILGGNAFEVNSLHHQAISHLAAGFKITAWAPDGVIEAIELPDHPFGIAVQWHPEWLQDYPPMRALFRSFVQASGEHIAFREGYSQHMT